MYYRILIVLSLLLGCGCRFMAAQSEGRLEFSVTWPQAEETFRLEAIPTGTVRLEISLQGIGLEKPVKRTLTRSARPQEKLTLSLPPGSKTIQAQGLDAGGKILASGSAQVDIVSGEKTIAVVELESNTPTLPGQAPDGEPAPAPGAGTVPHLPISTAGPSLPAPSLPTRPPQPATPVPTPSRPIARFVLPTPTPTPWPARPDLLLTSLSPNPAEPGTTLVISGQGFGLDRPESEVFIGTVKAVVLNVTETQISVTVPSNPGSYPVTVKVGALTSNTLNLTISNPVAVPGAGGVIPVNQPPVINSLTADPNPVSGVSYPTELTVSATDPESSLTDAAYTWSCDGGCGAFNKTNSTKVTWTAPAVGGTYTLRVTVSDGTNPPVVKTVAVTVNSGNNSLNLTVGGNGVQ